MSPLSHTRNWQPASCLKKLGAAAILLLLLSQTAFADPEIKVLLPTSEGKSIIINNATPGVQFSTNGKAQKNDSNKKNWAAADLIVGGKVDTSITSWNLREGNSVEMMPGIFFPTGREPILPNDQMEGEKYLRAECEINLTTDFDSMPVEFMPVSWHPEDYALIKILQLTLKSSDLPVEPGILIRRLRGNEDFWSKLKDKDKGAITLKITPENDLTSPWLIDKGRVSLPNSHITPIKVSSNERNNFTFNTYEKVRSSFQSGKTVSVQSRFPDEKLEIEIASVKWKIEVAVNTVSKGVPNAGEFSDTLNYSYPAGFEKETVVIWLNAVPISDKDSNITIRASPSSAKLLSKAGIKEVQLLDDDSKVLVTAAQLQQLKTSDAVTEAVKEPFVNSSAKKPLTWINARSAKEPTPRSWVNLADEGAIPECVRFIKEVDAKGEIVIYATKVYVAELGGDLSSYQVEKWEYAATPDDQSKKPTMRALQVEEVKPGYYVLLEKEPGQNEVNAPNGWTQKVSLKIGEAVLQGIEWTISEADYSNARDSNNIINLNKVMSLARQTKTINFQVSPLEALLQSKTGITLRLVDADLVFKDELDGNTITVLNTQQEIKPSRFIKPGAELKHGVMILVDNYQPWSVGASGASSLQGTIWDSVEKALSSLPNQPDSVVVGLVNQGYEFLAGNADGRQRQIALFKLRRLVFNQFDLDNHGTPGEQLVDMVRPDQRHDNAVNNTLTTLLPEAGSWKVCFVTPPPRPETPFPDGSSLPEQLQVKVSFVPIPNSTPNSDLQKKLTEAIQKELQ